MFDKLKHFKKTEFPEPSKMDPQLLMLLDNFRDYIKTPIVITSSTDGVHEPNSEHYKGKAVDIIVPDFKGSIIGLYLIAERFNFTGIGVYPHWSYKGRKTGGLHLDTRELKNGMGSRWLGINGADGKQVYLPLTIPNLKKHGILI